MAARFVITESIHEDPDSHKNCHAYFYHFPPIFQISWYTDSGSNQTTGIYWPHKTTLYHNKPSHTRHQWHSRFCEMLYQRLKEGNVLFNDALNTFYLCLYGVRHMVKYHTDSERGNPLPPHGLLFPINSKGSFICTIPDRIAHTTAIGWNEK